MKNMENDRGIAVVVDKLKSNSSRTVRLRRSEKMKLIMISRSSGC